MIAGSVITYKNLTKTPSLSTNQLSIALSIIAKEMISTKIITKFTKTYKGSGKACPSYVK